MEDRKQKAAALFQEGYNCSQAVFLAFEDLHGMDRRAAAALSSSFGGGMGRLREVCGTVTGIFMTAGMLYGYDDPKAASEKAEHYARIQELAKAFEEENGSIVCRELLGLSAKRESPVPAERTAEYYKKRPCKELVVRAVGILEQYILEHPPEPEAFGYQVHKTAAADLDEVMEIYRRASDYMISAGNPDQWTNGYPQRELIEADIAEGISYVIRASGQIAGVFTFSEGVDPSYRRIGDGCWLNDEDYGTIHRLAASGKGRGVAEACFSWCASRCKNLRADTHQDNRIMRHLLEKHGFVRCGIIHLADGAPRIAYQKTAGL